ncbi:MAG: valine--tRNA ligase [Candidatus Omnitrophica bacterium]|nr:valine--tRNA ligase [Candidatus Omnitrophota bacterium]
MNEIPTQYNPKEVEDKWYKFWEENDLFFAKSNSIKKPFSIVIPPPNITGILHMGHALNNTIQDILIRYYRMKGYEALWLPGTDHAGIATQNVVEKQIAKEGLRRQDLGREKFLERVWEWKEKYGSNIIKQLKRLGASCDWRRERFTMDQAYSEAVNEVFVRLYEKGLIYQGSYIINWCPRCQTALSDEEAPHKEIEGSLYYIRYPFKEHPDSFIVVATTRPETMLGDTAVAVHPYDHRYKKFIGKTLILPLINREIKIIADSVVDRKFGTGAVKVTPAHDPVDYQLGKKHNLEFINIMDVSAILNENAGKYKGLDRFQARKLITEDLKTENLLEKIESYKISVGHCYRCNTIIEPYLSTQWFVKMKPLAEPAIKVVKEGRIRFHPKRWTKVYLNWMENIKDWCISRQIWWGHRLPVYYCRDCQQRDKSQTPDSNSQINLKEEPGLIVSKEKPEKCPFCGSTDIYQDEDVLDTWFSSWLWPFATFYWPKETEELKYFYPTSVLVTAPEIIFFWVARMIMAGLEFMGEIPFSDVYIHGTVRDIEGRKMSKSLGNIIDPLEIIEHVGADALRFSLMLITACGQDIFLSEEKFKTGRNFANKIWNASRFVLMNLNPEEVRVDLCVFFKKEDLSLINRWILSRFYSILKKITKALDNYRFNEAANLLYSFFWHEFCDWYLEITKADIKDKHNQVVMYKILEKFLRILHPFMPFITEEIWQRLPSPDQSIMLQPWPHVQEEMIDKKLEEDVRFLFSVITQIRNFRSLIEIKPEQKVDISVYPHTKKRLDLIQQHSLMIKNLAKVNQLQILRVDKPPRPSLSAIVEDIDIYLHFTRLIDIKKEQLRIKEMISELSAICKKKEQNIKNKEFIHKAPKEIVTKERNEIKRLKGEIIRLEKIYNELC